MGNTEATILVVDDVQENTLLISRILENDNYHVHAANNGRDAYALLKKENIDLVILDINMPVIDGITVLKKIQESSELANIPVVMLTALDDSKTALECMRLGACGYISKPYNGQSLKQQIEYCLNKAS
jgi:CheY-like chemotaxis protein